MVNVGDAAWIVEARMFCVVLRVNSARRRRDAAFKYYIPKDPTPLEAAWMEKWGMTMIPRDLMEELVVEELVEPVRFDVDEDYRSAEDLLEDFYAEACEVSELVRCRPTELYAAYVSWCDVVRARFRLGTKGFSQHVAKRFRRLSSRGATYFVGLAVKK